MAVRRHGLTEVLRQRIEPLLPGKDGDSARAAIDNRLFVEAVMFVLPCSY